MDNAFDKGMENIIQQKYGASDMQAITDSVDKLQQQVKFRLVRTSLFFLDSCIRVYKISSLIMLVDAALI